MERFVSVKIRSFWYNPLEHYVGAICQVDGGSIPVSVAVSKNPSPEELMDAVNLCLKEAEYVGEG